MRFHVKSFGCQMSFHDGEKITRLLCSAGHEPVETPNRADLLIATTCTVRGKADEKLYSWLGRQKWIKRNLPPGILAVCGCLAQSHGRDVFRRAPQVDIVLGPAALARLPEHVESVRRRRHRIVDLREEPTGQDLSGEPSSPVKAWITIMEGCDNYCTYCIVPYVRGRERSRGSRAILREAEDLVAGGAAELILLGQNVNSYRPAGEDLGFPELLRQVAALPGLRRLRFVTSHPKDMSDALARALADCPALCPQIHLPVQSGSSRVLEAMRRGYTREQYLRRVELLREAVPGIALTTDLLVGFPGEREEDHRETLSLVEHVRFDSAFAFAYSPREGTAAAAWEDDVPPAVKNRRLREVLELQAGITAAHRAAEVGTLQRVLVEGPAPRGDLLSGRTDTGAVVHLPGPAEWTGRILPVRIQEATPHCLYGRAEGS